MPNTRIDRHRIARCAVACAAALLLSPAYAQRGADLTSLSLEQLMQVTVVGASKYEQKQDEVAAAAVVITRQELLAFGWRTLDQALASLPGVHVTYDRQYTYLGTRGFGLPGDFSTRVLVMINGNRANETIYDGGPMGHQLPLDLALVERIEFIPGPGGAVYGQNAMFGVINIVTRGGAAVDGMEVAAAYQLPQRQREFRASWGRRLEGGQELLLSASSLRARGEDRSFDYGAAGVSGVAAGLDGSRDQELFARASGQGWAVDLVYGQRRKDDPTGAYLSDPLVAGQYQSDGYWHAQAQFDGQTSGERLRWQARAFLGRMRYDSIFSYGTAFSFPARGDWYGTEARLLYTGLASHKLMLGLEAQENHRVRQSILDRSNPANDIVIDSPGWRYGLYVQDEWRIAPTWLTTLGVRMDRNSETGSHTSPRLALIWAPDRETTLKALVGRAHRAPNAYERDYDDDLAQTRNPTLAGERIDTYELVADRRVSEDALLRAALYRWKMHGLIVLGIDPVSGLSQYQSGEPVEATGLEISGDRTWRSGVRLRGSVARQQVSYAGGAWLINSPRLLAKLNLSAPLPWAGLHAGFEWRYDGARLTNDGSRLGGYAVGNLHLGTRALARGLEVTLGVGNVFGKRYAQPGADTNWQNAIEQDGRSVRLGLGWSF